MTMVASYDEDGMHITRTSTSGLQCVGKSQHFLRTCLLLGTRNEEFNLGIIFFKSPLSTNTVHSYNKSNS